MIFPLGIRGQCNRKQTAKGNLTKNETVQIKKWCKLVRGIKAKRCKTNGCNRRVGCRVLECFLRCFSISFPRLVRILLHFLKSKNYVYTWLPHMDINMTILLQFVLMHLLHNSSWEFLARYLQSSTNLYFVFPKHICIVSSWMELNLKVPSLIFENLQDMCIIYDKTSCRISIQHVCYTQQL